MAQRLIRTAVEISILPIPANGITTQPTRKVAAPSTADAVPRYFFSKSNAKLVEIGKVAPENSNEKNSDTQTMYISASKISVILVITEKQNSPTTLYFNVLCGFFNRAASKLPIIRATALTAKMALYVIGDTP